MSFIIKSVHSGMVLDVKESNTKHGAEIILYPYHGYENQQWTYKNGMIISKLNGFVLDIHPISRNVILSNEHCRKTPKWRFNDDLTISNKNGKVLDAEGCGVDPCTRIIAYNKHGAENQQFFVVPYDEEEEDDEDNEEEREEGKDNHESTKSETESCSTCYNNPHLPMIQPQHMPMFPYMYPWFSGNVNYGNPHFGPMQCHCPSCLHYYNHMQLTQNMKNCKLN